MRITYYSALFILIIVHIILPVLSIAWIWRCKNKSRFTWYLGILITAPFFVLLFMSGYWQQLSCYARAITILAYAAAVIKSFKTARKLPLYERLIYTDWMWVAAGTVISIILLNNVVLAFEAFTYKDTPVKLAFPFKAGVYMICFGGNGEKSPFINYHYKFPLYPRSGLDQSVIYAVDIVKLNASGKSARGFLPADNDQYEIFGETVYSPCDGEVVNIENRWKNESPFAYDYPYNPGNSIVIKGKDFYVLLGHLQIDSILVKQGDSVKQGQPIARVGNSGWTTEPHLHIQAMKSYDSIDQEGPGLPILFDGRFPVKNDLFIKK